jgi:hypothetical protein
MSSIEAKYEAFAKGKMDSSKGIEIGPSILGYAQTPHHIFASRRLKNI